MNGTAYLDTFANDNLPPREQWPELLFEGEELAYPERINCAGELLDAMVARGHGASIAVRGANSTWTYAELLVTVDRIAAVLQGGMGLVTGNRVLLRGANNPMMAACVLAVWKAGLVAVPTMPLLRAREIGTIIALARVDAVLCAADLRAELDLACEGLDAAPRVVFFNDSAPGSLEALMTQMPPRFEAVDTWAQDVCLLSFTSGTTGRPKGTMHFHRDVLAICDCFPRSILGATPNDVFIGTPPLAFTFGLGGMLLFPLRYGACAVLLEKLTPESLLAAIAEYRATVCFTAPTFYRQMTPLAGRYDLSSLTRTVSAGEALPLETRQAWQRASGLAMIDGIGATEMLHIFISAAGDAIRPGATGRPIPGYRACILDDDGNPLGPGVTGRLAVKGPTGCRYLADPRQLDYVCKGWNLTGDAYQVDADGYYWYQARTDDMIISAGYNIAGPEVEDVLMQHPAVAECGVVGAPDAERGQVVLAYVVLRVGEEAGPDMAKTLQDHVKRTVAPYKYPRRIAFRASLPRTETGKLQRFKLRQEAKQMMESS
ncbi:MULTISPECIES: AMP-binding protein [unclassified Massilia]|uniref:AMP-binding protein n=1 Tax=unclassified Massilia TaxID=2609279 RepID=UPI001780D23B|nr:MULTISPECIES: AMP-binding protein [unclassified Massilia]MBD8529302.1 AMP-binding protein [Massilia sp. CFBP 13647]MBD8672696.1 AMP-binding protein [Massilia sp. CFBP 13721]